jgi:ADP-ribose pyrophosphatase YjhB (NUDIX family)
MDDQSRESSPVSAGARYCLVCGARLTTVREEGRPRRRCPRCRWTFYDNPVPAVVAIVERSARILLTRRAAAPYAGTWDLPGGFLESGELPERGLLRELREELGTRATIGRLHGFSIDRYGPGGIPILAMVYVARLARPPVAGSDVAEVRWFRRDEIPWRQIGFASIRRTLREYLGQPARPRARARRARR